MKNRILRLSLLFLFTIIFICFPNQESNIKLFAQSLSTENSQIREIKISENTLATINNGDFVYPKFSPDGKLLAYSKVLVEDIENSEVHLFDLQNQKKAVLLNAKRAKKYAVYASFVADLKWLGLNRLQARISDGDVDSTILTFNTQTLRVIKIENSYGEDFQRTVSVLEKTLYKNFPDISREIAQTAFNMNQAFKIGNRGVVLQFSHAKADSNIWFFDFQTKQKQLLIEDPENSEDYRLVGALEITGTLLFIVKNKEETQFYLHRNDKIEQIAKTKFGGEFESKFANASKTFFLLKQPNYETEKQSSLWYFDGNNLSLVSDVENLCDVDIDLKGKMIAFCFWNKNGKRDISVRKIKNQF